MQGTCSNGESSCPGWLKVAVYDGDESFALFALIGHADMGGAAGTDLEVMFVYRNSSGLSDICIKTKWTQHTQLCKVGPVIVIILSDADANSMPSLCFGEIWIWVTLESFFKCLILAPSLPIKSPHDEAETNIWVYIAVKFPYRHWLVERLRTRIISSQQALQQPWHLLIFLEINTLYSSQDHLDSDRFVGSAWSGFGSFLRVLIQFSLISLVLLPMPQMRQEVWLQFAS